MRKQILTIAAAGVLGLTGVAVAGPALAAAGATSAAATVTSRVDTIKGALAGLVTDGTLTQAQADKVATTLDDASNALRGGKGGHDLTTAATALGMTQTDLRTALQGGRSLAQVAQDKGIAVDKLIAALVAAEKTHIAQEVTDGKLTQAQADQRLAGLTSRVTDRVNSVHAAGSSSTAGAQTPVPTA